MLLIVLLAFGAYAQETADSVTAQRKALRSLVARAGHGEPDALFHLARLHEQGYDSIPVDTLRAVSLYRRSAEAGYAPAENYYGFLMYKGIGMPKDTRAGIDWIAKAAAQGNATAANNLGFLLLEGDGMTPRPEQAVYWLRRANENGVPEAAAMLGDLYREGRGVEQDSLKAVALYNEAILAGLRDAQLKLLNMQGPEWEKLPAAEKTAYGRFYYTHGAPSLGVWFFERAAAEDDPEAMALMGDALTRALGAAYDHDRALDYYYRAARAGNAPAQFVLGELLEFFPDSLDVLPYADEIPDDHRSGSYWLQLARQAGISDAESATRALLDNE